MSENSTNNKEYPIYRNQSIFVYIVALVLAFFIGRSIFTEAASIFGNAIWGYAIGSIIGGYFLSIIIYELGKLIFAKIGGYRLVSLNLFGFTWIKTKNNKTKFKFTGIENFGGKTLLAPKNEKSNPYFYLLGGTVFSIIIAGVLIGIGYYLSISIANFESVFYIALLVATVSLLVVILNIAPVMSDDLFDGFILRLIVAVHKNKDIFHYVLLQQEALLTGKNDLQVMELESYHDPLKSKILIYNCYYYLDLDNQQKVKEFINLSFSYEKYLLPEEVGFFYSLYYYYALMNEGNYEKIGEEYWNLDKSIRKLAGSFHNFETLKTALLIAAFVELSYDNYEYITLKIEKLKSSYYPLRQEKEDALIEKTLQEIERKKPEWFKAYDSEEETIEE